MEGMLTGLIEKVEIVKFRPTVGNDRGFAGRRHSVRRERGQDHSQPGPSVAGVGGGPDFGVVVTDDVAQGERQAQVRQTEHFFLPAVHLVHANRRSLPAQVKIDQSVDFVNAACKIPHGGFTAYALKQEKDRQRK